MNSNFRFEPIRLYMYGPYLSAWEIIYYNKTTIVRESVAKAKGTWHHDGTEPNPHIPSSWTVTETLLCWRSDAMASKKGYQLSTFKGVYWKHRARVQACWRSLAVGLGCRGQDCPSCSWLLTTTTCIRNHRPWCFGQQHHSGRKKRAHTLWCWWSSRERVEYGDRLQNLTLNTNINPNPNA